MLCGFYFDKRNFSILIIRLCTFRQYLVCEAFELRFDSKNTEENHPSQHSKIAWKISFVLFLFFYQVKVKISKLKKMIYRCYQIFENSREQFCEIQYQKLSNNETRHQNQFQKQIKNKMQIKPQSLLIVGMLMMLCLSVECGPYICTNCYSNGTTEFQCNGQECQAFYWPYSSSSPYGISCLSSSRSCYWSKYLNQTKMYLYTACNYTMYKCGYCDQQDMCYKCQKGYGPDANGKCKDCGDMVDKKCLQCDDRYTCTSCAYGYMRLTNYSTGIAITTCLSCSSAIPGCITCDGRSSCTFCQLEYIPMNGLCYQKDGKTLANSIDYQYLLTNLQQDMNDLLSKIFVALIIFAVLLFLGIATMCWTSQKSTKALEKRSLLSSHD